MRIRPVWTDEIFEGSLSDFKYWLAYQDFSLMPLKDLDRKFLVVPKLLWIKSRVEVLRFDRAVVIVDRKADGYRYIKLGDVVGMSVVQGARIYRRHEL